MKVKLRLVAKRPIVPEWAPAPRPVKEAAPTTLEGRFSRIKDYCESMGFHLENYEVKQTAQRTMKPDFGNNTVVPMSQRGPVKLTLHLASFS